MPHLDLTELELKILWGVLDAYEFSFETIAENRAFDSAFDKVYRAYRGMPPKAA
jgi:hypothetical protein